MKNKKLKPHNEQKIICFVAGKSGGHIIPCLTLIPQLTHYSGKKSHSVLFFSTKSALDKKIILHSNAVTWHVQLSLASFNASQFLRYPLTAWQCIHSFIVSFFYLYKHKPSTVITTGGIVAIPVCLAAFIVRIPITLYVLDAIPGKALKALAPLATTIALCFTQTRAYFPQKKFIIVPYPIRFNKSDKKKSRNAARMQLNLDSYKKTILLLGGSQGSLFLNQCAQKLITHPYFQASTTQIIHQTGSVEKANWYDFYKNNNVTAYIFSYSHNLAVMYNAADIIICRGGAGTLFEILFFKKQCIVIPLTTDTTTHQIDNAQAITQTYPHLFTYILQKDIEKDYNLLFSVLSTTENIVCNDTTHITFPTH